MIRYLAQYLKKPENDLQEAAILVGLFSASTIIASLFRNFYIYYGYTMALEARKLLVSAIFDKVGRLSMRSLTETNSGKLITLVSADIFTIERPLAMAPFGLASPFINFCCYGLIWYIAGWYYALMMFGLWVVTISMQVCSTRATKAIKQQEAMRNDERMKLVNDMITGIRTIKAYAWETHYAQKVTDQRRLQESKVFMLNLVGSLGFSVF